MRAGGNQDRLDPRGGLRPSTDIDECDYNRSLATGGNTLQLHPGCCPRESSTVCEAVTLGGPRAEFARRVCFNSEPRQALWSL